MTPSLSSITLGMATTFRQQQLSSENARLSLQNNSLLQENSQLESENADLRLEQRRLNVDNRHLRQQVGDLQRELTVDNSNSGKNNNSQKASTTLDVYA